MRYITSMGSIKKTTDRERVRERGEESTRVDECTIGSIRVSRFYAQLEDDDKTKKKRFKAERSHLPNRNMTCFFNNNDDTTVTVSRCRFIVLPPPPPLFPTSPSIGSAIWTYIRACVVKNGNLRSDYFSINSVEILFMDIIFHVILFCVRWQKINSFRWWFKKWNNQKPGVAAATEERQRDGSIQVEKKLSTLQTTKAAQDEKISTENDGLVWLKMNEQNTWSLILKF